MTNCPGFWLVPVLRDAVMAGRLDYVNGRWINPQKEKALEEERRKIISQAVPKRNKVLVGVFLGHQVFADPTDELGEWKLELSSELTTPVIEVGKLFAREYSIAEKRVAINSTVNSGGLIR